MMWERTSLRRQSGRPRPVRPGVAAGAALLAVLMNAPGAIAASTTETATPAATVRADLELQARSNLPANDAGWNLPPGTQFNSISPDLNDRGQVAFPAQLVPAQQDPSSYEAGVWLGGHGAGALVHRTGIDRQVSPEVGLNEAGDIAFTVASGGVDNALYRYDAATGTAARVGTAPVLPNSYSSARPDEAGNIGFQANFGTGRAYAALRGGTGVIQASDRGLDPASPYTYLYTPRFNDAGQAAAKVATSDDFVSAVEIRRFDPDGNSTLVLANKGVDPTSPYRTFNNSLGLANNGTVAVIATRDSDGRRVLVRSDGETTTEIAVASPDSPIRELEYFAPGINDAGQVVFRAKDAQGQAIYLGDGEQLTRVAAQGDLVQTDLGVGQLGQHDTSPVFGGAPAINAAGDVVFTAGLHPQGNPLAEWGTGVFVAYAGGSPEPPAQGLVSGTVTDANDSNAIVGASVALDAADGSPSVTGRTGDDGSFEVTLAPGDYVATISAPNYTTHTESVTITADAAITLDAVLTTGVITTSPTMLDLAVAEGQTVTAPVTLSNDGSADLRWQSSGTSWLTAEPSAGTLAPGEAVTVTVTAGAQDLPAGTHSGTLEITGNAGRVGSAQVPVTLTVEASRELFTAAVNVGGGEHVAADGTTWSADQPWTEGSWGFLGAKTKAESTKKDITGTEEDGLFQTRRAALDGYRFDDVPAGTYEVALGFAELKPNPKPGDRRINVRIGDEYVLVWHDVADSVGGLAADLHTFTVTHGGGPLEITLQAQKPGTILSLVQVTEQR